ncbi:multicopper oxidase family protein [Sphaerothrix gracilis]|uniref:multicopper oxidase family protein n=1 Tax=Sphaerothrix gracilis TaxID=3151835 RepID=UPI0031FC6ECD
MSKINRRKALQLALAAGGAMIVPATMQRVARSQIISDEEGYRSPRRPPLYRRDFEIPLVLPPVRSDDRSGSNGPQDFSGTDYYDITMEKTFKEILPGTQTEIWAYGPTCRPEYRNIYPYCSVGGSAPGPTIKQVVGRQSVVRQINNLFGKDGNGDEIYTSVHLHGMASLPQYDGWADDVSFPGQFKDYIYPNNRAATIWYHDHGVHRTAINDYMGLAALYIEEDPNEKEDIPKGEYDVPLLIADKLMDRDGQLVYADNGQKDLEGDIVLVNGVPWPVMQVKRRKYRFRILNSGISRAYKLKLSNRDPLTVIASDGGLLESPVETRNLVVGVAERYEVVIDFAKYPAGTQIELRNGELKNHERLPRTNKIMRFDVVGGPVSYNPPLPNKLRNDGFNYQEEVNRLKSQVKRRREIVFERHNGMWAINGRFWADGGVEANPGLGDVEIWKIVNKGGGWNHPVHIHLIDFLMMNRKNGRLNNYERGFKDVIYLGENQEINVLTKFGPHVGKYMFHCHNVVHEDHDMMRALEVGQGGPDPVTTTPAQPYDPSSVPPL